MRAPVCMCGARVLLFPSFIVQDFSERAKNEKRSIAPDRQKRQDRERLLEHTDPYIAGSGNSISVEFPSKQEKQTRNGLLTEKKKKKNLNWNSRSLFSSNFTRILSLCRSFEE